MIDVQDANKYQGFPCPHQTRTHDNNGVLVAHIVSTCKAVLASKACSSIADFGACEKAHDYPVRLDYFRDQSRFCLHVWKIDPPPHDRPDSP